MDLTEAPEAIRRDNRRRALAYMETHRLATEREGLPLEAAEKLGRAARIALGPHEDPEHCAQRVVLVKRRSATV